jgi:hypothetical protein
MIHSKAVKPRIFPWLSERTPEQINRAQDIGGDLTLNREKQYEIGRDGILGYKKNTPAFKYSMKQFEYGAMELWYSLANLEEPGTGADHAIDLDDLKTKKFDIAAFLTDDSGTFEGTIWFPKLRVNGFTINIADPDAIIERNFDLVGEDYKILNVVPTSVGGYLAYQKATASGASTVIVLNPVPVAHAASSYIFKVLRERAGVVSELVQTTDWTFAGPATVTVTGGVNGDVIKVFYEASTAYTTTWTNNDVEADFLTADSCEIYMKVGTGTRLYRLQSLGIDISFERTDYKELGNPEIVLTGAKSQTVKVSLDRYAEDFSLEKILAGDTAYPYIDPRDFSENIQILVKVFSDKSHTAFKIGYLMNKLTPTTMNSSQTKEDYGKRTTALECDNLKISDVESEVALA